MIKIPQLLRSRCNSWHGEYFAIFFYIKLLEVKQHYIQACANQIQKQLSKRFC